MRYCPGCGAMISDENKFCEYCGADVQKTPEKAIPEPQKDSGTDERIQKNGAPPTDRVSLKKVSPTFMGLFALLTFYIYLPVWLLLRQKTFDEMAPELKINVFLPWLLLGAAVLYAVTAIDSNLFDLSATDSQRQIWSNYFVTASFILSTILTFRLRSILRSYAAKMDPSPFAANLLARSVLWSVLLQFIYIQSSINLLIESGLVKRSN